MGGKFIFELKDPSHYDKAKYLQALKDVRKLRPSDELYVSSGQQEMGVSLIVKVKHKAEWTLVLPTNPVRDDIECSFTYGIVSRRHVWEYVRSALSILCGALPGAFEFKYEDHDLEGFTEVGFYDYKQNKFVVEHYGLPAPESLQDLCNNAGAQPRKVPNS